MWENIIFKSWGRHLIWHDSFNVLNDESVKKKRKQNTLIDINDQRWSGHFVFVYHLN